MFFLVIQGFLTFLQRACVKWNTHPLIFTSGRSRRRTLQRAFSKSMVIWRTSGSTISIWRIDFRTCTKKKRYCLNNSSWNNRSLTCHLNSTYQEISSTITFLWLLKTNVKAKNDISKWNCNLNSWNGHTFDIKYLTIIFLFSSRHQHEH